MWRKIAKDAALIKQDGRCKYCKRSLKRVLSTSDHVVPRSKNGRDDSTNIAAACRGCNCAKGSIPVRQFTRMIHGNEPPANYGVAVQAVLYRLEKRAGRAVANILAVVGQRP